MCLEYFAEELDDLVLVVKDEHDFGFIVNCE